ncbi:MAG: alanine dehydrogenase [Actinobacteria bacterium]|uniref:alanine dehydrogenase n=1 Tax=freshwater metagenome TaxID=449393 RepID=A0A6J7EYI8_9ZZZZ|nr:alanine dehydrogenase [Actinomycetota bacterium]
MRIGVPSEIKNNEFRVAITPSGVVDLVAQGHDVLIESGAGTGSGLSDDSYTRAGAQIVSSAASAWNDAELVLKVKEPQAVEYPFLRDDLVLFTFLHLAAEAELTAALLRAGTTAIAYETVQASNGSLPLLAPMSEVAGRLAPLVGANVMMSPHGGPGLLISGVPGTHAANVVVLGGGVAGTNAIQMAVGLGAQVTVLDTNLARLAQLDLAFQGRVNTIASNRYEIERAVIAADLVIGAVLIPGAKAPKLVSNKLVAKMQSGSVLVDIAVDQGGCFEDTHPTTHTDPTFAVHKSIFYCVANMPGAVPHTSTYALTNATLPFVRSLANKGWRDALRDDEVLRGGLNTWTGQLTNTAVGAALDISAIDVAEALA